MARKDVLEIFNGFNDEQKQFVGTKKIEANFKIKKWLELLENVAIMDAYADDIVKRIKALKLPFIIAAIVIFFASFIITSFPYGVLILLLIIAIYSILLFVNYSRYKHFNKLDLSNGLRLFTIPLLKVLREETDKENLICMKLNFNDTTGDEYLIKKIENTHDSYPKVVTNLYKNQWMTANTELSDEVKIDWSITDLIVKKNITKRNARGKYKSKTKLKTKHSLRLTVIFPKSKFELLNTPKDFPYEDKNDCHIFKLKGKAISDNTDTSLDMNYFLDAIATSFSCVQPIKS